MRSCSAKKRKVRTLDKKCSFCSKYFDDVDQLAEHIKQNHKNAKECSYCFAKFPPWYFKEHVKHCSEASNVEEATPEASEASDEEDN